MKFEINTLHKDSSLEIIGKQKHEFANIIAIWNEDILKQAEQRKENNEREDKQT
ncbi:integrase, partial [Bacillus pseudomycoides]